MDARSSFSYSYFYVILVIVFDSFFSLTVTLLFKMNSIIKITSARSDNMNRQKKRKLNVHKWKFNIAKLLRNSGQAYVSYKTNQVVPAKQPPHYGKICARKCHYEGCSISDVRKHDIWQQYNIMGDWGKQRCYLHGLITKEVINNRNIFKYSLSVNGERKQVCQRTFLDVHKISRRVVRTIQEKITDLSIEDGRGKHGSHRKVDPAIRALIRRHIFGYVFQPIHYSRNIGNEECLPTNMNVNRMIRDFEQAYPEESQQKAWLYRCIFAETGILIQQPRTDTCRVCDRLHISITYPENVASERVALAEMHSHQVSAGKGYEEMYGDINTSRLDTSVVVKVIDLQKVLFSPTLSHQDMFYMRQFSSYNLCIYDGRLDQGFMYFWNETEAKRGVNEMASSFLDHILLKYNPLQNGEQRKLIVWSDRCRGQFNNYYMLCLYMMLINRKLFTTIEHKFLVSGHSYMPCDRLFGLIEKRKRKSHAYCPDDWKRIIMEARPSQPFIVEHLIQEKVFNIQALLQCFPRPADLKVTELAIIKLSATHPGEIYGKSTHETPQWSRYNIYAPNQGRIRILNRPLIDIMEVIIGPLQRCYFHPLPLSQEKKNNLQSMLPFLPPQFRQFYQDAIDI